MVGDDVVRPGGRWRGRRRALGRAPDPVPVLNDRHGHEAGDEVLQGVVAVLGAQLRATDLLGRWGGEEFLVVAAETEPDAAASLAERCRAALARDPAGARRGGDGELRGELAPSG